MQTKKMRKRREWGGKERGKNGMKGEIALRPVIYRLLYLYGAYGHTGFICIGLAGSLQRWTAHNNGSLE